MFVISMYRLFYFRRDFTRGDAMIKTSYLGVEIIPVQLTVTLCTAMTL